MRFNAFFIVATLLPPFFVFEEPQAIPELIILFSLEQRYYRNFLQTR